MTRYFCDALEPEKLPTLVCAVRHGILTDVILRWDTRRVVLVSDLPLETQRRFAHVFGSLDEAREWLDGALPDPRTSRGPKAARAGR